MGLTKSFLTSALLLTGAVASPDFAVAQNKEKTHKIVVTELTDTLRVTKNPLIKPSHHQEIKVTPLYQQTLAKLYDAMMLPDRWAVLPADKEKGIFSWNESGWNCHLIINSLITRAYPESQDPKENQVFIVDHIDVKSDSLGHDAHTTNGGHIYRGMVRQIMIEEVKNDGKNNVIIYYREYDNAQDDGCSTPSSATKIFWKAPSLNDTSVYEQISLKKFQEVVQAITGEVIHAKKYFHELPSQHNPATLESIHTRSQKPQIRKR